MRAAARRPLLEALEDRTAPSAAVTLASSNVHARTPIEGFLLGQALPADSSLLVPSQMLQAYGFNNIQFPNGVVGDGSGQTIAIVDAFADPNLPSDLATFDATFQLPAPPSLILADQNGNSSQDSLSRIPPDPTGGWELEECLDVEWAHAVAPQANILLLQANSAYLSDLLTAVDTARKTPGVVTVSMSWAAPEFDGEQWYDSYFTTPAGHTGVTFVAATGDWSAPAWYPAFSPNVLAVGGTLFNPPLDASGNYTGETGWSGSGGGISAYEAEPSYQRTAQSTGSRTTPDVAFDAATPVAIYDTFPYSGAIGWWGVEGTSLSTPCWAALIAIADQGCVARGHPTLADSDANAALYTIASSPASYTLGFHDITTGNNGFPARLGYDYVTGFGTPIAPYIAVALSGGVNKPTIGSLSDSPDPVAAGNELTLTANDVADADGTVAQVAFYRESNGTAGLQVGRDTLVGTDTDGSDGWSVTISTAGLAVGTYTYYAQATDSLGTPSTGGTSAASAANTVGHAPAFTSAPNATFVWGRAGSVKVTATGYPTPVLTEDPNDTLPTWLTFNPATHVLSGTPPVDTTGPPYTLHFYGQNGVLPDAAQQFTLTVIAAPAAPRFTSPNTTTFAAGNAASFTVTASGSPTPVLSESSTDKLPSGVTFSVATGLLSGTPAAGTGRIYILHFVAANRVGANASQTFTLAVNEPPSIISPPTAAFRVGVAGSFTVTTLGFPRPVLSHELTDTLPQGVGFNASTGVLSGTPAAGMGRTYVLHLTADNGLGSAASQTLTLTVTQPTALTSARTAVFTVDAPGSFTVTASGFPPPTLTESGSLPSGVTFTDNGDGTASLTGTPSAGGNYPLIVTAHINGVMPDATQALLLTVATPPTITPTGNPLSQTVAAGDKVTFTVDPNDVTGWPLPTVQWQMSADGGGTFVNIPGCVTATMSLTATAGRNGEQFRAMFTNVGGEACTSAAQLTVTPPPKPAVIWNPVSAVVAVGQPATFTAAASANPVPGVQWQVSTNGGVSYTNITGATSTTLSIAATAVADSGKRFRAVFNNGLGQAITTAALLTVDIPPAITLQPVSEAVNAGQTVTFSAAATGTPAPSVQWQVSTDGGLTYVNITGATARTLSFVAQASQNGNYYRAVFTNPVGQIATVDALLFVW